MTGWRIDDTVYCELAHPAEGVRCELPADGHSEHVYTEWRDGEIAGPVWWSQAP